MPTLQIAWERTFSQVLDLAFPPRCAGCARFGPDLFCADCAAQLEPIQMPFCFCCGSPFDPLAKAAEICAECRSNRYHDSPVFNVQRSVYEFEGPLRRAVHRFKYKGKTALAAPLSTLLFDYLQNQSTLAPAIPWQKLGLIVPVPLFSWRRHRRGYNQSTLLGQELAKKMNIPCAEVLRRTRHTTPQVRLSARERSDNVRGAFAVEENIKLEPQKDASILLLDDVCTTGATLHECARVLRQSGENEIYALTLAKQI